MEQARVEWLDRVRLHLGSLPRLGQVIVTATCNFILPLTYPGSVEVRMSLGAPARSSVESYYDLWSGGRRYADGSAKIVWIDSETLKSTPMPDALREFCARTCAEIESAG
jgi:acyl-CoA thioester hydrolase